MARLLRIGSIAAIVSLCMGAALVLTSHENPPSQPRLISCTPMSPEDRVKHGEIKHGASPNVGGMGMFPYEITRRAFPSGTYTETVHATVALRVPKGYLLGSDRGEFGGELALAGDSYPAEQPRILFHDNIEDLFLMDYGMLATTGYLHLDADHGSVLRVTFPDAEVPHVDELFKLPPPSEPRGSPPAATCWSIRAKARS